MMNKEKRVDEGLGHVEGDDEDRRLGCVGRDRAMLSWAQSRVNSGQFSPVAD